MPGFALPALLAMSAPSAAGTAGLTVGGATAAAPFAAQSVTPFSASLAGAGASGAAGTTASAGAGGGMGIMGQLGSLMPFLKDNQSAAKLGLGAAEGIGSMIAGKKAKSSAPPLTDAGQLSLMEEMKQRLRSINTGSAFSVGRDMVQQTGASTRSSLVKSNTGNVNQLVNMLLRSQSVENRGVNQVYAQNEAQRNPLLQMLQGQVNNIASRRLDLQMHKMLRSQAQQSQLATAGMGNAMSGLFGV